MALKYKNNLLNIKSSKIYAEKPENLEKVSTTYWRKQE